MAIFHYDDLAKNLPDCYQKDTGSNNYKILEIERHGNETLRSVLDSIEKILDIANASGEILDMYGERFGQPRGIADDTQYRIMIKSKIARSTCSGSYKDIVDALCYTFGCSIDDLLLLETEKPLTLSISKIPLDAVEKAGFSLDDAEKIIRSVIPVGVLMESVYMEGTFEFGSEEYENGEATKDGEVDTGFSWVDDEENERGGYLGHASSATHEGNLPI